MKNPVLHRVALSLVIGMWGAIPLPAHADNGCPTGQTFLGAKEVKEGQGLYRYTYCAEAPGPWSREELDRMFGLLSNLPDTPAKAWTMKHVMLVREPRVCWNTKCAKSLWPSPSAGRADASGQRALFDNGQLALFFNDRFFSESPAVQRSLFAFESGKALFLSLGPNPPWFDKNLGNYNAALREMGFAGRAPGEPNADLVDGASALGGLFRVAMLQIPPRAGWREPLARLDRLLRSKP